MPLVQIKEGYVCFARENLLFVLWRSAERGNKMGRHFINFKAQRATRNECSISVESYGSCL